MTRNSAIAATSNTVSNGSNLTKKKGKRKKGRQKIKDGIDSVTSIDPKEVSDPVTRARIEALNKFSEHAKSPEIRQLALVGAKEHLEKTKYKDQGSAKKI